MSYGDAASLSEFIVFPHGNGERRDCATFIYIVITPVQPNTQKQNVERR